MKLFFKLIALVVLFSSNSFGQSAILQNDGVLVPKLNNGQMTGIGSPEAGQLVFNTSTSSFWYHNGSIWTEIEANTDNQTIDVLSLNQTTLHLSLSNDGQSNRTLDLSSLNSDEQSIDVLSLLGNNLNISLSGDGEATKTLDLSSLAGGGGGTSSIYMPYRGYVSSANYGPRYNLYSTSYSATAEFSHLPVPRNGTIAKLSAICTRTLDAGSVMTLTVMINGSPSGLTTTMTNSDGTNLKEVAASIAVTSGQKITVKSQETGGVHPGGNTVCSGFVTID